MIPDSVLMTHQDSHSQTTYLKKKSILSFSTLAGTQDYSNIQYYFESAKHKQVCYLLDFPSSDNHSVYRHCSGLKLPIPWIVWGLLALWKSQIVSHLFRTASGVIGWFFCLTMAPKDRSQRTNQATIIVNVHQQFNTVATQDHYILFKVLDFTIKKKNQENLVLLLPSSLMDK